MSWLYAGVCSSLLTVSALIYKTVDAFPSRKLPEENPLVAEVLPLAFVLGCFIPITSLAVFTILSTEVRKPGYLWRDERSPYTMLKLFGWIVGLATAVTALAIAMVAFNNLPVIIYERH